MPWWGWIAVGALLLAAEMGLVDAEFYLVFLGVSALLVGLALLAGVAAPVWLQWLLFAALAVGSLAFFRGPIYQRLRGGSAAVIPEGVTGERALAVDAIAPGATGSVTLRGTRWNARNDGLRPVAAGAPCRVERIDGLLLRVRPEE